jgi:hypothetical protein
VVTEGRAPHDSLAERELLQQNLDERLPGVLCGQPGGNEERHSQIRQLEDAAGTTLLQTASTGGSP